MSQSNQYPIENFKIVEMVNTSIDALCREFQDNPTLFFTENDLVCKFYELLPKELKTTQIHDCDKNPKSHRLVHMEYPTPFRCDMNKSSFRLVSETQRKITNGKEGGKYKRGHYDIVILNPLAISQFTHEQIRGQDFELFKSHVKNKISHSNPMILYAIEFMLHRGKMNSEKTAQDFIEKIMQDYNKLEASRNPKTPEYACPGFVQEYRTVAFYTDVKQEKVLREKLGKYGKITLQPSSIEGSHQ